MWLLIERDPAAGNLPLLAAAADRAAAVVADVRPLREKKKTLCPPSPALAALLFTRPIVDLSAAKIYFN